MYSNKKKIKKEGQKNRYKLRYFDLFHGLILHTIIPYRLLQHIPYPFVSLARISLRISLFISPRSVHLTSLRPLHTDVINVNINLQPFTFYPQNTSRPDDAGSFAHVAGDSAGAEQRDRGGHPPGGPFRVVLQCGDWR